MISESLRKDYSKRFNYDLVGSLLREDISEVCNAGFTIKNISATVGKGIIDFEKASSAILRFNMTNMLDWVKIIPLSYDLRVGDPISTNSRFYSTPLWTLNPCKIVSVSITERSSHILYGTVDGHLIAGEEIFKVFLQPEVNIF